MRILACIGDTNSIQTHGGLPYFLLEAARRADFIQRGLRLRPEALRSRRIGWNLWRLLTAGERGGYQYSRDFLDRLVTQAGGDVMAAEIVSTFPLFPPVEQVRGPVSFYIDATLTQGIVDYAMGGRPAVGPRAFEATIAREREQYRRAERVLCRSRWAATSLVEQYGLDEGKVHVIRGGANLPPTVAPSKQRRLEALAPLRLGFVGKDWRRKNLPFLLTVADVLHARGVAVEVIAAGFDPARGPRHPRLHALGYLNKRTDLARFVDVVTSFHFGCLLSLAEAFGISNLECIRLGVPVLGRDVGGIRDTVPEGLGHLFPPEAEAVDVADVIQGYVRDPDAYWPLRERVISRCEEVGWDRTVARMMTVWSGSQAFSYAKLAAA